MVTKEDFVIQATLFAYICVNGGVDITRWQE